MSDRSTPVVALWRVTRPHAAWPIAGRVIAWLCVWLGLAGPCAAAEWVLATTRSPLSLPVHVAASQGYFKAEGLDVKLLDCVGGPRCMNLLFDGSAQLMASSELPVVFGSFERNDFAVIATMGTTTRNNRILARKSAGISTPQSLAGKRIGLIPGGSSHYYVDAFLLYHDVDPQQTRRIPLQPAQVVKALVNREVDAIAVFSRLTAPAMRQLGSDGLVLEDPHVYTETYNLVAMRNTLAQSGPDLQKVLRALQRAQRFIAERPQQSKALMQTRLDLGPELIEDIYPGLRYQLGLTQSLVQTMESVARWSLREGHVAAGRKIPNYLDFVDPAPLRAAVPSAVRN